VVRAKLFGECEDVVSHGFLVDEHYVRDAVVTR
jgi:hypothetical protein